MVDVSPIGLWTARLAVSGKQVTRWHLVESEIADRLVTRCGHEMVRETNRGHLVLATSTIDACKRCVQGPEWMLPAPPMSKARRRAVMRYVERVRNALYLRTWRIDLPDEYPEKESDSVLAQIDPCDGRYIATIRLGPGFWKLTPDEARETIVHELLHLHHVRVTDAVRLGAYKDELGQNAYDQLVTGMKREAEYMTDVLTSLVAPSVAKPSEWPA